MAISQHESSPSQLHAVRRRLWPFFYLLAIFIIPAGCIVEATFGIATGTSLPLASLPPLVVILAPIVFVLLGVASAPYRPFVRLILLAAAVPAFFVVFWGTVVLLFVLGLGEAT